MRLNQLLTNLKKVNPNEVLQKVLKENDEFVKDQVRDRLNEKGERSTGEKIKTYKAQRGVYANKTIFIKMAKGQPTDRVTLKDTGDFQRSFELKLQKELMQIKGDSDKPDGRIEDNLDMSHILDLSDDEQTELVKEIKSDYVQKIKAVIGL